MRVSLSPVWTLGLLSASAVLSQVVTNAPDVIPNQYIVMFNQAGSLFGERNVTDMVNSMMADLNTASKRRDGTNVVELISQYDFGGGDNFALQGFAATFTDAAALAQVNDNPNVAGVYPDLIYSTLDVGDIEDAVELPYPPPADVLAGQFTPQMVSRSRYNPSAIAPSSAEVPACQSPVAVPPTQQNPKTATGPVSTQTSTVGAPSAPPTEIPTPKQPNPAKKQQPNPAPKQPIPADDDVAAKGGSVAVPAGLWGLDAIDGTIDRQYSLPAGLGQGVDVYVIDSGIATNHPDFGGRAKLGRSFTGSKGDDNGHGTHVAGTIAGTKFGVARKANLYSVTVMGAKGTGATSAIIAGMQWTAQAAKASGRPSVVNMSIGGGRSPAMDRALQALVAAGVPVFVAAGNERKDACTGSPSGSPAAFVIGATSQGQKFTSAFSNFGRCVKGLAPGDQILSASNKGGSKVLSGTSMASPHAAGVGAVAMSANKARSPQDVYAYVTSTGQKDRIAGTPGSTINLFLNVR
ncbi:peptidase S8/S53 domain-containing protein [Phlyctochytrium arcticum]|nr:peptidase S8/S53 domain-containing protein [Phlyctochytrium arcticum]